MYQALVLEKNPDFSACLREVDDSFLPEGDVTVDIDYSTINFKDGLAITNKSPVVRSWPMVAGIDGSGTVTASDSPLWKPGDQVVLNGFGVGETHKGCLAGRARLKSQWLIRRPERFSAKQAMAIGTAGYTAMLCVLALERHGVKPGDGEVLVTGATGGVGSTAIALLSRLGYTVVAATGKASEEGYLKSLGAASIIDRNELSAPGKPLQKERWAAVVDAVGSHTLVNACAQTRYGGAVAACGLAQGFDFPATVMPFILRGVALLGVDSVMAPLALREQAWSRLAVDLDAAKLDEITTEVPLSGAIEAAQQLMAGQVRGRIAVRIK
ncbi:MDR family oxidoreductase [Caenimonas koreensis]|uniref:Acryloyl-CoA reductase n=1 Tax=Caenimonas koreensis DSM 17982 TaxID=1121255 RepID=A0A844AYS0_9BURK|nr:MDR family oxidoreductase [Caenimonas koreensis]MRD45933.1 acryloyl-CoA reductase [Caenimonas koreensis DSM 17982]